MAASQSAISVEEVRRALASIVVSPAFSGSPQLASFLRFVVEATLSGHSERIKGYTIAVEALGREDDFDPQADPIVRVEAGRLRRALDRYYDGPGKREPVVIALPRGSYVPTFQRRQVASARQPLAASLASAAASLAPARAGVAFMAALLVALVGYIAFDLALFKHVVQDDKTPVTVAAPSRTNAGERRLYVGPSIYIAPITVGGQPDPLDAAASTLASRLRDIFARFDDVIIVTGGANDAGGRAKLDYRLVIDLEHVDAQALNVRFQLVDEADGSLAWAHLVERLDIRTDPRAAQLRLAREVAGVLLQPYGVVHARERLKLASRQDRDPRYACLVESFEYFRTYNHSQHARVRGCLEDTTRHDPTFASGFSSLARVYFREFLFDLSDDAATKSLDRALDAARTAIDLNPNHVRAYFVLLDIHMARGEIAEAMAAGERVLVLNPYDSTAVFHYAAQLVLLGDIDRGMRLINDHVRFAGATPMRYGFIEAIAAYFRSDFASAAAHANQLTNERFPLGLVLQAVTRLNTGERERARLAAARLSTLFPAWRDNPRRELKKFFPLPWVVDRIEDELRTAGLADTVASLSVAKQTTKPPSVLIEPVDIRGSDALTAAEASAIRAQIVAVFGRFEDVEIVATPAADLASGIATAKPDYRVATTVSRDDGGLTVAMRLVDGGDGTALWSKSYEGIHRDDGSLSFIDEAAATLLHPIGVVATRERIRASDRPGAARYRCVLEATDYLRSFVPARHAKARACLEEAVAADPAFAGAFTTLARVYLREHQFSINARPGDSPPLERALAAAKRAVALNPKSARAHFIMFEVLGAMGDVAGVRRHGELALSLNPNDQSVVFHYGAQLIMMGEVDAGAAIVRRVAHDTNVPPARLDFALFLASYLKGDMAEASRYAKRITNDAFIPGYAARALAALKTEGAEAARFAVDRLAAVDPAWRTDPRSELAKFITSPALVDRFARELAAAGLGTAMKASQERASRNLTMQ
jgi:tetratricopeptide (TPR) repeat protein